MITNQRLIDSYKRIRFSLRVSTADLVNVQDMTVARNGLLAHDPRLRRHRLPDGGSRGRSFRLAGIPNPREVQALVDRERDRERMRLRVSR